MGLPGIRWLSLKVPSFHHMRNRGGERGFQCLWTWIQNWFQILLSYCFIAHDPKSYSITGLWFPEDVIDSEPTFPHKALHWMALNCQEIVLLRMPNHVIDIASAELFETFLAKWSTLILRDPYSPVKFTHPNQSRFNSDFLSRIIPTSASLGLSFIILVVSRDPLELYSNKCHFTQSNASWTISMKYCFTAQHN